MSRCAILTVFAFLVAHSLEVRAQVDHRVNRGNSNTGGYALDKNAQVGSGGYNLTRPGFDYGAGSNAVITGNVTGLGAFRGPSPVLQANQFRADLPSSGLSSFQSRSIGTNEIAPGRVPTQTFFFDPNRTIANVGQIQQGLNAPGSSRLSQTTTPPQTPDSIGSPNRLTNLRDAADTRLQLNAPPEPLTIKPVGTGRVIRPVDPESIAPAFRSAASSPIFGSVGSADDRGSSVDVRLDRIQVGPSWEDLARANSLGKGPTAPATLDERGRLERDASSATPSAIASPSAALPESKPQTGPLPLNGQTPANLGGDRFADLYNSIRAADQLGVRDLGFKAGQSVSDSKDAAGAGNGAAGSALVRKSSESLQQMAGAAKWARDTLEDPVTTFVGRHADRLNESMAAGEEAMRQGEYYKASRLFDLARTVDPMNPLPYLHRGHALAAAGDYVTATHSLEEGIRRFPQIAAFKLDLIALVGQRDVFDVRRADIEARLASREQGDLRFLLGYLELYSGFAEQGMKDLREAAKAVPADSPIAQFAALVAGDRPLPKIE